MYFIKFILFTLRRIAGRVQTGSIKTVKRLLVKIPVSDCNSLSENHKIKVNRGEHHNYLSIPRETIKVLFRFLI